MIATRLGLDAKVGSCNVSCTAYLQRAVLGLYDASPLPSEHNPYNNLGQVVMNQCRTLVWVAAPNETVNAAMLKQVCLLRDSLMQGWDKVTLLCWDIDPELESKQASWDDNRFDLLTIPANLPDRLHREGGADQLKGRVCFASLSRQQLAIKPITRIQLISGGVELLIVTLQNYFPHLPHMHDLVREGSSLPLLADQRPLALIEYWAIDAAYDGQLFRPIWQRYRDDETNPDCAHIARQAVLNLPPQAGSRCICVRAVDLFHDISEVVATANAPVRPLP